MKFEDVKAGDTIGKNGPDGELWEVVYASPDKIVARTTIEITDLTGWEKISLYGHMASTSKPHPPA